MTFKKKLESRLDEVYILITMKFSFFKTVKAYTHRIIINTDRILDVILRFKSFSFTVTLRQKPKGITRMLSLCLVIQCCLHGTPLSFCLRVIVNEKILKRRHLVFYLYFFKIYAYTIVLVWLYLYCTDLSLSNALQTISV